MTERRVRQRGDHRCAQLRGGQRQLDLVRRAIGIGRRRTRRPPHTCFLGIRIGIGIGNCISIQGINRSSSRDSNRDICRGSSRDSRSGPGDHCPDNSTSSTRSTISSSSGTGCATVRRLGRNRRDKLPRFDEGRCR